MRCRTESDFNQTHNLTFTAIWELPGSVLRGWSVAALAVLWSGFPYSVSARPTATLLTLVNQRSGLVDPGSAPGPIIVQAVCHNWRTASRRIGSEGDCMDQSIATEHAKQVASGERFEFGRNWGRFLAVLSDERIAEAQQSLQEMLGLADLRGRKFLDVGSGSGLFSLAARRMGGRVHSFDYDPQSVACTAELRRRYFPGDGDWTVEPGSALDDSYLNSLGTFDIVYSWGVLHHTGEMWQALKNMMPLVAAGGYLFIAIYNDQGKNSRRWKAVKRAYNRCPKRLRFFVLLPAFWSLWWRRLLKDLLHGQPLRTWAKSSGRGMSPWWDVVDWVGGYPFEVAKPEEIFDLYSQRGFTLIRLKTQAGDLGCNEFVFRKAPMIPAK